MKEKQKPDYPLFTKDMKQTHTILMPEMLPLHQMFLTKVLAQHGYKLEILKNTGRSVVEEGLKNVHNDTCYPALLVIGQMIDALKSGKYDLNKTALMITQTGGGCRASNYIFLLRKALKNCGLGHIPVISLNLSGLDSAPGFKLTLSMLKKAMYAIAAADLMMWVSNQCYPYEKYKGATDEVIEKWMNYIMGLWNSTKSVSYKTIKELYIPMLKDFSSARNKTEDKPKVGIVGEIYVKYAPMGNNNLNEFLISEGAEPVLCGLLDFCMYSLHNGIVTNELYGGGKLSKKLSSIGYNFLLKKQHDIIDCIKIHGEFDPPYDFNKTRDLASTYINPGVKMGEGWLLTAEMGEFIAHGVENIICAQPFGCLPNHIVGKGMLGKIKRKHPEANIVAIDYDPGASEINQQNRIKLMLANAKDED